MLLMMRSATSLSVEVKIMLKIFDISLRSLRLYFVSLSVRRGSLTSLCGAPTSNLPNSPKNQDKIVKVEIGKPYIPESLFPETGWNIKWENKGIVDTIKIIQW